MEKTAIVARQENARLVRAASITCLSYDSLEELKLTQQSTDRIEFAVRTTVSSIMSGRAIPEQITKRLEKQGFQAFEIDYILKEAFNRMSAFGEAADRDYYQSLMKIGGLSVLLALVAVAIAGFPQHGRGVGIFYTAILFGLGSLLYGAFGRICRK